MALQIKLERLAPAQCMARLLKTLLQALEYLGVEGSPAVCRGFVDASVQFRRNSERCSYEFDLAGHGGTISPGRQWGKRRQVTQSLTPWGNAELWA